MKLKRLEITNVRGIRSQVLEPDGANLVIWGPNGSGKSAVVDAVDFLLTGRVARLTGEGTRGITLARHGPHIDSQPQLATVTAFVEVPGITHPVRLSRCLANPDKLVVDEKIEKQLSSILAVAARGQHVLTRREILRFLVAEAGSRAQQIQALLDLSAIENVRKSLVRVRNDTAKGFQAEDRALRQAQLAAANTAKLERYDASEVLKVVNTNRAILGAGPVETCSATTLKQGVSLPKQQVGGQSVNLSLVEHDLDSLRRVVQVSRVEKRASDFKELTTLVDDLNQADDEHTGTKQVELSKLGLELLDESGTCPLCEAEWPLGQLHDRLTTKLQRVQGTVDKLTRAKESLKALSREVDSAAPILHTVTTMLHTAGLQDLERKMQLWGQELRSLSETLGGTLGDAVSHMPDSTVIATMASPANVVDLIADVQSQLRARYPEATPEQTAWDTLTRLEENIKALEAALLAYRNAETGASRAEVLLSSFVEARDAVLGDLYNRIVGRFAELYRDLHGSDEGAFHAEMRPDGAGLLLNVDFYGRGTHPPHALHSEGHQDSMGLCLYLALSEYLTQGLVHLTILDDVMMSVDSSHRRQVCAVIRKHFTERQFLITTHDRTWAHQLRAESVVTGKCTIEFYNWSIETGPHCSLALDLWATIEAHLAKSDVSQAAALLRRGSEEFFAEVCDALEAPVKFRLDGRNDLGDYLPSAVAKYRSIVKKAKAAAQSWGHAERAAKIAEAESVASSVFQRSNAEQWAINTAVHFNNWHKLAPQDFRAVFEAFQDLHNLFVCQTCRSMLTLSKERQTDVALRCRCTGVSWNLLAKGKEVPK